MSEEKQLETTKILSLTDESGAPREFISEADKEVSGAKLKYYMWLSRLFILFATISLLVFMSSSLALFDLAPRVTVEPFLIIKQDNSEGIVRYEPIEKDIASKQQLMKIFVEQYVILRNTIIRDEAEMMLRWYPGGMVNFLSSDYVFYEFDNYRKNIWQKMLDAKIVREVEIISADKLGGEKSPVWKVDFVTYDLSEAQRDNKTRGLTLRSRYWTASVTAYFIKERQFVGLRLINPLGFTVTRYSQTEVEF
ncbi:MAG: type IV secretion system protein [Pseudomonadota bacterium]|nr:type IV secretion system protein [Pseudomonadota bacterium]